MWGAGTILGADLPRQINHGVDDVAVNLLRYLGHGATLVSGPAGSRCCSRSPSGGCSPCWFSPSATAEF